MNEVKRKQTGSNRENNNEAADENYNDVNFQPTKKNKPNTITLEVPRNIFADPLVTAMIDKTECTNHVTIGVLASILKAAGADLKNFNISKDTVLRQRNKQREVIAARVKSDFKDKKPECACLHWDGKLIDNVTGSKDERLAVLISGAPHFTEGKVIGIPRLMDEDGNPTSTGEAQFEACLELIEEWEVIKNICAICYDTTSSNTGIHRGACTRIEVYLDKKIFWFGCRHHVPELIAGASWYRMFDEDPGPHQQVKNVWPELDTSCTAPYKKLVLRSPFLLDLKAECSGVLLEDLKCQEQV